MVITLGDIILLVFIIVVGWMAVLVALATIFTNQKPKRRKKKMNMVILMGRLVRDPDVRYSNSTEPMAIARFTLAVDRKMKKDGKSEADFISCIAFGKTGEFVEKYLTKGTKVVLNGHWQTGSYTNKEGAKVYTNDCVVDSMEFAESKKVESNPSNNLSDEIPQEFMTIPEEELPFN
jgi:single-strand DNA-binding protein